MVFAAGKARNNGGMKRRRGVLIRANCVQIQGGGSWAGEPGASRCISKRGVAQSALILQRSEQAVLHCVLHHFCQ